MTWFVITPTSNDLIHHGVKGQKWGIRRYQNYDGTRINSNLKTSLTNARDPKDLADYMKKNIGYSEYSELKSPEETIRTKSGSCHDQVMLELEELKNLGFSPKAAFLIEYDPKTNQGGTTHSFAYYNKNGKTYWLENAWSNQSGLHEYDSQKSMIDDVFKKFKNESTKPKVIMTDFGNHQKGETLQELVDISLNGKELKRDR